MFKVKKKLTTSSKSSVQTQPAPVLIHQTNNFYLYKYVLNKNDNFEFVNWDKNRPPDEVRIKQIVEHIVSKNCLLIPGIIYTWKRPCETSHAKEKLYVYDGIHRLLAGLETKREMTCLVGVLVSNDEQDIIDDFLNINKSISVPSIYLEETSVLKKMVCQYVADEMCRRYPAFVSPSRKPYVYNFNRDNLVEFISTLQVNFCKSGIDKQIVNELIGLNSVAKEYVSRNKIVHPRKCQFHNFYLFFYDKVLIKHRLEEVLM